MNSLVSQIKANKGTFRLPDFESIHNALGLTIVKGGNSSQKADIILDIEKDFLSEEDEGFGIKSFLGSKPTLLNASGNTNFIFEIANLSKDKIDEINAINPSKNKLIERIKATEKYCGTFKYVAPNKKATNYNLKMVNSHMPEVIGSILLTFYQQRVSAISQIVEHIYNNTDLIDRIQYEDKNWLISKVKQLLVDILL